MASMKPNVKPFLRRIAADHLFERGQAPFATDATDAARMDDRDPTGNRDHPAGTVEQG